MSPVWGASVIQSVTRRPQSVTRASWEHHNAGYAVVGCSLVRRQPGLGVLAKGRCHHRSPTGPDQLVLVACWGDVVLLQPAKVAECPASQVGACQRSSADRRRTTPRATLGTSDANYVPWRHPYLEWPVPGCVCRQACTPRPELYGRSDDFQGAEGRGQPAHHSEQTPGSALGLAALEPCR
jgi:hypothetical protein